MQHLVLLVKQHIVLMIRLIIVLNKSQREALLFGFFM